MTRRSRAQAQPQTTLFVEEAPGTLKAGDKVIHGDGSIGKVVHVPKKSAPRNEIAKSEPPPVSMLSIVAQLARDPAVNPEKMQAILNIQKELRAEEARMAFTRAKVAMRKHLPVIDEKGMIEVPAKTGKTGYKRPHAKMIDINIAIKPVLDAYGFDLWFEPSSTENGKLCMIGHLEHVDGHYRTCEIPMSVDESGGKNNQQGVGSSYRYAQRYATVFLLNIDSRAPQDTDDDAKAAGKLERDQAKLKDSAVEFLTPKQVTDLEAAITDCGIGAEKFCAHYSIAEVSDLPPKLFSEALKACRTYKENQAGKAAHG